ncbi:hypothetical protein B0H17DRAFT_1274020 [Mycena rosella]|uniref:Uncharacterized protein n=1 Tax=Mycena rosella TaxID=1033263 RepID=A0AAD7MAS3_MYCRO|nr:hypothetical protein B0H17DRAFT_1274020 [Mycena rosella]
MYIYSSVLGQIPTGPKCRLNSEFPDLISALSELGIKLNFNFLELSYLPPAIRPFPGSHTYFLVRIRGVGRFGRQRLDISDAQQSRLTNYMVDDVMLLPAPSPELKARCIAIRKTVSLIQQLSRTGLCPGTGPGYVHLEEDNQPGDAGALYFVPPNSVDIEAGFMCTARLSARPEHTYVLSSSRGNGNGAKLMQELKTWSLQQPGFHVVQLEAQEGTDFTRSVQYSRIGIYETKPRAVYQGWQAAFVDNEEFVGAADRVMVFHSSWWVGRKAVSHTIW